jgi:hypothetical protein
MSLLASILASAEGAGATSQTSFYVLGGALAGWAVLVSLIGIAKPDFPGAAMLQRVVMVIGVVLVAGAMSTAVLTA